MKVMKTITNVYTNESIPDHDPKGWIRNRTDLVVSVLPELAQHLYKVVSHESRGLVQQLNDVEHPADVPDDELEDVESQGDVGRVLCPGGVGCALARVVVPVLRTWKWGVGVHVGMYAVVDKDGTDLVRRGGRR